jgi:hypothetical protein
VFNSVLNDAIDDGLPPRSLAVSRIESLGPAGPVAKVRRTGTCR